MKRLKYKTVIAQTRNQAKSNPDMIVARQEGMSNQGLAMRLDAGILTPSLLFCAAAFVNNLPEIITIILTRPLASTTPIQVKQKGTGA